MFNRSFDYPLEVISALSKLETRVGKVLTSKNHNSLKIFFRMDPLHFCIAVVPLAVYLLMIGYLNFRGQPFVTTGARDSAALGIGLVGLVISGPMILFFPESAASHFGNWVWAVLLAFYGLFVSMFVLLMRPRIVIYNISADQLRPILTSIAMELDPKSRWAGDSLLIPAKKVHLHIEATNWLKNVQLTSGGNHQSFEGWRMLEAGLNEKLKDFASGPNLIAFPLLIMSLALAVTTAIWMLIDTNGVAAAWEQLRRY